MASFWDKLKAAISIGNANSWSNPTAITPPRPPAPVQARPVPQRINVSQLQGALNRPQGSALPRDIALQQTMAAPSKPDASKAIGNFAAPFIEAGKGIVKGTGQALGLGVEDARLLAAVATHNQAAKDAAAKRATQDLNQVKGFVQFAPRAAAQVGLSVKQGVTPGQFNEAAGNYTPQGLNKLLLGDQPIQSFSNTFNTTAQQDGKAKAYGTVSLTALADALALKGGVESVKKLNENTIPISNEVGAVGKRVNIPEPLKPLADMAKKYKTPKDFTARAAEGFSVPNKYDSEASFKAWETKYGDATKQWQAHADNIKAAIDKKIAATQAEHQKLNSKFINPDNTPTGIKPTETEIARSQKLAADTKQMFTEKSLLENPSARFITNGKEVPATQVLAEKYKIVQPKAIAVGKSIKPTSQKVVDTTSSLLSPPKPPKINVTPVRGGTPPAGKGTRQYPETVRGAPTTPPDYAAMIKEMPYTKVSNPETFSKAITEIQADPIKAIEDAVNIGQKKGTTAVEQAKAMLIQHDLIQKGQLDLADKIVQSTAKSRTETARALQIGAAYARTTPTGIYNFAKQLGADSTVAKSLYDRATEIAKMPEGRPKDLARATLMRDAAATAKVGLGKKAQQGLYFAQLLNAKTAIRNVLGNAIASGGQNLASAIGAPIDVVVSAVTGKPRSTYFPNLLTQAKGFGKGFKQGAEEAKLGVDLLHGDKYGVKPGVLKSRVGKGLEKTMSYELSVPDRAFYQAAYEQKLSNLMRGAKVKEPTPAMIQAADEFGKNMTYQNDSAIAEAALNIKKSLNMRKDIGLGSIVLNYPKTPANLLNFAIDFSPGGLAKALIDTVKPLVGKVKGEPVPFNKDLFVQNLSRGIVGTGGLVGTGAILHNLGILTADENKKNKDVSALQRSTGLGKYKINVTALKRYTLGGFNKEDAKLRPGDQLVSYDWAQPLSIAVAMGANLDQSNNSKLNSTAKLKQSVGGLGNNFSSGIQTLTDQPLLQGIQGLTGNQGGITQGAIQLAQGVPTAFIPSAVRQVRQLTDNTARNTYDPTFMGKVVANIENAIPGLSKRLSAQISPTGTVNEMYPGGGNNWFNVFFNPAFVSKYNPNDVTGEITRLYGQTSDKSVVPNPVSPSQKVDGKNVILSPTQYNNLQRIYGGVNKEVLGNIISTPKYQAADDQTKTKMISNAISDALAVARQMVLGGDASKLSSKQKDLLAGNVPDYSPKEAAPKKKKAKTTTTVRVRRSTGTSGSRVKLSALKYRAPSKITSAQPITRVRVARTKYRTTTRLPGVPKLKKINLA